MARRNRAWAYQLEQYGLTPGEFRKLGTRPVRIKLSIPICPDVYPGPARFRQLLAKSPAERRAGVHAWRVRQYQELCARMSPYEYETEYYNSDPVAMYTTVPARAVRPLLDLSCVDRLEILRIKGRRRRRRTPLGPTWFAVKARFAIQYEDETRGMQDYEDRIVLVWARSEKDAERKAMREFRKYERLSLTVTGHFFRWSFEKVLDVYQTWADDIDPDGTEVHSEMRTRRIKPEYEWHPSADKR